MSRTHEGHWNLLAFGNPFRMIFPMGSHLSPKLADLLHSFEQTLSEGLKKLKPKDISDVLSLTWMRHAIEFLSETHSNIKSLITDLEFPLSDWDEKWIDIYLDSSVKLLDICIALSSELSRLDQGQLLLQYVLHVVDLSSKFPSSEQLEQAHNSLCDWMKQITSGSSKIEDCVTVLQGLGQTLYAAKVKNSAKGKVLMRALYGVKVVTIFVCGVFTSALSGHLKPTVTLHVPHKFFWAAAYNDLQTDALKITSQLSREKVVLKELEAVEKCAERLRVSIHTFGPGEKEISSQSNGMNHKEVLQNNDVVQEEKGWKDCHLELAEEAERLSLVLDLLSKQVEDFFQIVLTGRDALLCNLRACDDVIMQEDINVGGNQ